MFADQLVAAAVIRNAAVILAVSVFLGYIIYLIDAKAAEKTQIEVLSGKFNKRKGHI